jgi:phage shock protein PspC (stress-responsive transcriptional regulator)
MKERMMRDIATPTAPSARAWQWGPLVRKSLTVVHAICGIGWMGVDIAVFALLMTARTTDDPALVASGFNAIRIIVPLAVPALSLGMLATGVLLGLGTRWGLIRYWWVLVKLIMALIMVVLVFASLVPAVTSISVLAPTATSADELRARLGSLSDMLLFPPIVSFLMLGVATVLSIFKPWRRTPWSRAPTPIVGRKA